MGSTLQIYKHFVIMTSLDDVISKNRIFLDFRFALIYLFIEISCGYTYSIIGIPFSTHNGQGQRSRQDFSLYERFFFVCLSTLFFHSVDINSRRIFIIFGQMVKG